MTANPNPLTLIGEEISGPWNAEALADIAQAFGGCYLPYDGTTENELGPADSSLLRRFDGLIAAENRPGARNVYEFRPPPHGRRALLVGNEAKGLRRRTLKQAETLVEIPILSKNVNCLNVAAAAAVLLYYLSLPEPLPLKSRTLSYVQKSRPDLLLIGGHDPMELGSTIRSACAFGWERVALQDRGGVWYECDRMIKSAGRGAARRGRNPIRVVPHDERALAGHRRIVVFTTQGRGEPPQSIPLIDKSVLIVLEDEWDRSGAWSPPTSCRAEVVYASLPPAAVGRYHYRQMASIALAEVARQLGRADSEGIYLRGRRERYRREIAPEEASSVFDIEDLSVF